MVGQVSLEDGATTVRSVMTAIEAEYRDKYIPKPLLTAQQGRVLSHCCSRPTANRPQQLRARVDPSLHRTLWWSAAALEYNCPACTFVNPSTSARCAMCDTANPTPAVGTVPFPPPQVLIDGVVENEEEPRMID